jgi:hypothetical protein
MIIAAGNRYVGCNAVAIKMAIIANPFFLIKKKYIERKNSTPNELG